MLNVLKFKQVGGIARGYTAPVFMQMLLALHLQAVTLPYANDFESADGYTTTGYLVSDVDWAFDPNLLTVEVTDTQAAHGTQSLLLTGTSNFTLGVVDGLVESYRWIDFYLKPVFVLETELPQQVTSLQPAVTAFVTDGSAGEVFVVDGDGLGGGSWVSSQMPIALQGGTPLDWVRITYRLDYSRKTWDLYVNGQLSLVNMGFLDDSLTELNAFSFTADPVQSTALDTFFAGIVNPLYSDADQDGIADSVDLNSFWMTAMSTATEMG